MTQLKRITAGMVLAGATLATPAMAAHLPGIAFTATDFTFDATAYGAAGVVNAKYIDFSYEAEVDQFGCPTGTCFTESGVAFFGSFREELGNPPIPGTGIGNDYGLYAVFTGDGTVTDPGDGSIEGVFDTFSVSFFIDPNLDTTATSFDLGAAGGDETKGVLGDGDDVEILTGTLIIGGFHVAPGLAAGDFDVAFDVTSYDASVWGGEAFEGPVIQGDINGVNTTIEGVAPAPAEFVDGRIIGSGNVAFQSVPAPGSLALLGLGLAGLGVLRRRS